MDLKIVLLPLLIGDILSGNTINLLASVIIALLAGPIAFMVLIGLKFLLT